ncbi:MAG: ATP-binding protein [Candidatus Methanoperedens sp.]|nr:ATP-binding protein [Candidatus Methanoperedens sp.]
MISKGIEYDILIVEDSPTQAEELKFLLEKNKYKVRVARNGREAIDLLKTKIPTIVITDIVMPEMDGYQLCKYIKSDESLKRIPLVLLTSLSDPADVLKGMECGADNFLTKPYDEKILVSRLKYLIINMQLRDTDRVQMGVEVFFGGQKYFITAQRQQILDLLFSTYETAVWKNIELVKVQKELKALNERLEGTVEERTSSLKAEVEERKRAEKELEKYHKHLEELVNERTKELQDSEERYRRLVEFSPYGIAIHSEGKFVYMNLNGAKILGAENPSLFIGKPLLEIIHPDDQKLVKERIRIQREGKVAPPREEKFLRLDGTPVDVEIVSIPFTYKGKLAMYGVYQDITARKQYEAALMLARDDAERANMVKANFLHTMSHELRTPLNAIMGFSELLKLKTFGELSAKQNLFIDHIFESGNSLLNIINQILDVTMMDKGILELCIEKISLQEIVDEVVGIIKEKAIKKNIIFERNFDPDLEYIEADKKAFKKIIINLIGNAVKFSKLEGGNVTISTKKEGNMAMFSVSDTGIGIKKDDLENIFQKFTQLDSGDSRKYEGTGIGLTNTKQLVELHGGNIRVESKYGEGSTFTVRLPLVAIKEFRGS